MPNQPSKGRHLLFSASALLFLSCSLLKPVNAQESLSMSVEATQKLAVISEALQKNDLDTARLHVDPLKEQCRSASLNLYPCYFIYVFDAQLLFINGDKDAALNSIQEALGMEGMEEQWGEAFQRLRNDFEWTPEN